MLPQLPVNARYIYVPRPACQLGLGMVSEAFKAAAVKKEEYRYFLFVSSAVRGPFLPTYAMVRTPCFLFHKPYRNPEELRPCRLACKIDARKSLYSPRCFPMNTVELAWTAETHWSISAACNSLRHKTRPAKCKWNWLQDDQHWSHYFTQKLTDRVKLVGPTISCQTPQGSDGNPSEPAAPPHVQFTAVATDQASLGLQT